MAKKAFGFHFKNPIQGSEEALTGVLFINDAPTEVDVLRLEAEAEPDVTITLKVVDDKVVSDSNYHFKLTFRPEALALPEGISLDASHDALWGLVCIPEEVAAASAEGERARAPGDVDLYFLYKGNTALEVSTDNPLRLTQRQVGAASKGGTRTTLVQLTLNKRETEVDKFVMIAGGPGGDYNLTENAGLDLLASRGLPVPTLMAGFVSSDIILNDGAAENGLVLRIVNTGLLPISLSPEGSASPSRFTLRFEAHNTTSLLWALGTTSQVSSILIPAKQSGGSWVIDSGWSGKDDWTVTHLAGETTWTLTPKVRQTDLSPGEALEVPIGKIVTGHATGRTALRIGYSGLPGHGDGELVAFIQKYPLVFAGQNAGVGTGSPSEKLTVQTAASADGITHTGGTVRLTTRVDGAGAALGTRSAHDLRFFTGGVINNMVLKTDGKVGIGTSEPSGTLTVHTTDLLGTSPGITHTNKTGLVTTTLSTRLGPLGAGLGTQTNHPLNFFTNNSLPQMTLKTDGKVGIGTASPSEMLTVHAEGDGITQTNGTVKICTVIDEAGGAVGTRSNHDFRLYTNGTTKMTVTTAGNVGIGTTSPTDKLTVHTSGRGVTHTNGTVKLSTHIDSNSAGSAIGTYSNHDLRFDTNSLARMVVTKEGRVGIGTTTPVGKLDVHGDFMINGKKPIECWSGVVRYNAPATTNYSTSEWIAVIGGFDCSNAPDPSHDKNAGFNCHADWRGATWVIRANLVNIDCAWYVQVIFIRRELVSGSYSHPTTT